ncbi:hypothetical protein AB0F91_31765 [Amycolatopsis sp. NPDC023774]|uniref:hypothetical protein n=1 Tax=Amycolatopsis sp. NPDC023774 TaxID=3155015 RepID=UPI0033E3E79F
MCRSSAHGGRRCAGGSSRSRTHAAIRQRVSRACHAAAQAAAAGDTEALASANARLDQARSDLDAHNTAHQAEQEPRMEQHEQPTPDTAAQAGDVTPKKAAPSTPNTPPAAKTPKRKAKQSSTRRQPRKSDGTRRRSRSTSDVVEHPRSTNTTPPNWMQDVDTSARDEVLALWGAFKAPERAAAQESTADTPPPASENHQAPPRESHSDTSTEQPHEQQTTSDQPRVTEYTAPDGTRFTNYAAPGATVGEQVSVNHGSTTFTSGGGFDPFSGPGRSTRRAPDSGSSSHDSTTSGATNVAEGNDYVEQQIGIQFGRTHRRND